MPPAVVYVRYAMCFIINYISFNYGNSHGIFYFYVNKWWFTCCLQLCTESKKLKSMQFNETIRRDNSQKEVLFLMF